MPVAHWFSHGHYVWTEILSLQLESPEMTPDTPKTCLHLICHKNSTSWAHISVESMRETHHITSTLNVADCWIPTHSATLVEYPWGKMICPPTLGNDSAKKAEIYGKRRINMKPQRQKLLFITTYKMCSFKPYEYWWFTPRHIYLCYTAPYDLSCGSPLLGLLLTQHMLGLGCDDLHCICLCRCLVRVPARMRMFFQMSRSWLNVIILV